jgi:phytoene dehydrogenase-like protein
VYTHLPRGVTDDTSAEEVAARVDAVLEAHAPGFADRVLARVLQRPGDLHRADANLVGGAVNGGTAQLFQQLVFRPVPGLGRPETVIKGLYLGSASAHIPAAACEVLTHDDFAATAVARLEQDVDLGLTRGPATAT